MSRDKTGLIRNHLESVQRTTEQEPRLNFSLQLGWEHPAKHLLGLGRAGQSASGASTGLQCVAGTGPVSFQSGQMRVVKIRWHCDRFFRHTVDLWANTSRKTCTWAQAYYLAKRKQGKSHSCALRCLGQRWLKILWKMWQTHTRYDPDYHARNQQRHGSWVLQFEPAQA